MFVIGLIAGSVGAFLIHEFNHYLVNRKTQRLNVKILKSKVSVKYHLDSLRNEIGANRVAIINYIENGATMLYESAKEGTPEIQKWFKDINSTPCLPMLLELEEKGYSTVDKHSKDDIKRLHNAIQVKSSFKYRINKSISEGCLVVAFSHDHELTPNEGEKILKTIKEVKHILCTK
ncbi:MAG TPA: hypothetical protein PLN38_04860 [Chitinophagales bacterium]|nr:hypothetical protein [Chitinophagales bacterium]